MANKITDFISNLFNSNTNPNTNANGANLKDTSGYQYSAGAMPGSSNANQALRKLRENAIVNAAKVQFTPEQIAQMMSYKTSGMQEMEDVIGQMKPYAKIVETPEDFKATNISPWLAASDFMGGTNYLKGFKTPEQERQAKREAALENQMKYAKVVDSLAKDQKDLLQAFLLGTAGTTTSTVKEKEKPMGMTNSKDEFRLLGTAQYKGAQKTQAFAEKLDRYKELVDKYGVQITGPAAKQLQNAYTQLQTAWKEEEGLGAITGPDMKLIIAAIAPSSGAGAYLNEVGAKFGITSGIQGVKDSIALMRDNANKHFESNMNSIKAFNDTNAFNQLAKSYNNISSPERQVVEDTPIQKSTGGIKKISGRTPEQEARYQELLRKKQGK